jgi:tetratricopeptide (TPR) repeat protein
VLEKGEKATGADDQVIYQKFRLYAENEKYNEALVELEKLIKSNPYDPTFLGIAAEVYESMGQKDKAKELYSRILQMDPNNGIVHLSLAQLYWFDGDKNKAQEELKVAMSSGNLDIDSKIKIILDLYVQPGNAAVDPKVYELLNLLEVAHPNEGRVFSLYGDLLFREKKYKESREKFAKAVELDKSSFITWSNLISLDSEIKDWNAMYTHAKEASELFPSQASFYYFYAYATYQKGNYKETVETALMGKELVFENPPLQFQFWELLGNAYHQLNLHTESDAAYDEALRLDPNNAFLLNNYAYYLSLRKTQLTKAAEMSKKSNALIINQASFEDTYAWILFLQKDYVNAELWLKKALEHGGSESGVILEHYGDVLFFLNKKEEALNYWKKAKSKGGTGDKIDLKISDGKYHE